MSFCSSWSGTRGDSEEARGTHQALGPYAPQSPRGLPPLLPLRHPVSLLNFSSEGRTWERWGHCILAEPEVSKYFLNCYCEQAQVSFLSSLSPLNPNEQTTRKSRRQFMMRASLGHVKVHLTLHRNPIWFFQPDTHFHRAQRHTTLKNKRGKQSFVCEWVSVKCRAWAGPCCRS